MTELTFGLVGNESGRKEWKKGMKTTIIWGFPKIRGTLLGVPIISILGSTLGSPYFGKLPYSLGSFNFELFFGCAPSSCLLASGKRIAACFTDRARNAHQR